MFCWRNKELLDKINSLSRRVSDLESKNIVLETRTDFTKTMLGTLSNKIKDIEEDIYGNANYVVAYSNGFRRVSDTFCTYKEARDRKKALEKNGFKNVYLCEIIDKDEYETS